MTENKKHFLLEIIFLPFSIHVFSFTQLYICALITHILNNASIAQHNNTAWLVSAASLIFCFGACLSYSLCLGDVSSSLAQTFGWRGIWASRQFWIILLTTTILYPLCNLQSLIALAPLSLAGVAAVLITTMFIAWRCPFVNIRSPYSIQGGGQLLRTLSPQQLPKFQSMNKGLLNPSSLILFGMAASAYL